MVLHVQHFVIFQVKNGWIVYNTRKKFTEGHTHIRNKNSAIAAAEFVHHQKIPRRCGFYYLKSLIRLTEDTKYATKIVQLIETRKDKNQKQQYINNR